MKDALALGGDEGRDKLRKAAGRSKYPLIRGYPNGATRRVNGIPPSGRQTRGTETSQYPEEEKTKVIAQVVASERAAAQTGEVTASPGLKDRRCVDWGRQQNRLESRAGEGESPVSEV